MLCVPKMKYFKAWDTEQYETNKQTSLPQSIIRSDAYPKLLLARTRNEETDYEGIRVVDIPRWLLMENKEQ